MTRKPSSIVVDQAGPEPDVGPLDRLTLRDRLDLATRLADRLVEHVLRHGNADAVERQVAFVRSESLVPVNDVDPEHYEVVTRNCATDMLVHAGPRGVKSSLLRDYRVFTGRSEIRSSVLAPGLPLSGRVLPVGAVWIFAGTPAVFSPSAIEGVVHGVVGLLMSSPCPAYRNPRTLARARELVADHHRDFRDLFGDVVVEARRRASWTEATRTT